MRLHRPAFSGGTISGSLTVTGSLTVNGNFTFGDAATDTLTVEGIQIIDNTDPEAFLVRKNADAGDIFLVDTTNSDVQTVTITPFTTDASSLGTSLLNFSDLFLDLGAVINFDSGDVTITHATDLLTVAGGVLQLSSNLKVTGSDLTTTANAGVFEFASANVRIWALGSSTILRDNGIQFVVAESDFGNSITALGVTSAGVVNVGGSSLSPTTTDTSALGTTALMWSDLFLASGGVINFDNGDVTLTHAANALTFAGQESITVTQAVATTGSPTALTITGGAHTTLTASTEAIDANFNLARTVQFATGALTTQRAVSISAPTYGFVGASTITNAATVHIDAPSAGTNATITGSFGLWVASTGPTLASVAGLLYHPILVASNTLTITGTTQVTSTGPAQIRIGTLTITDASAITVNTASGLYIAAAPVAAGSVTISNSYAMWIDSGELRLDGRLRQQAWTAATQVAVTARGFAHSIEAATQNFSNASSTIAIGATVTHSVATFTGDNATLTFTNAATLYIADVPVASTNVAFTNPAYSLWIDAGLPRIDSTTANGTTACVLTATSGPAAAQTAVQEWLTVSINGTTRFIPCW